MDHSNIGPAIGGLVLVAIGIALYLLPTVVAVNRRHWNLPALIALNLLLGWTLVGWVAALVWALARQPEIRLAANPSSTPKPVPGDGRQPCPRCAEPILPAAQVCRFCGSELAAGWAAAIPAAGPRPIADWKMPAPYGAAWKTLDAKPQGDFGYWDKERDGP